MVMNHASTGAAVTDGRLRVVLCGSFRRDQEGLVRIREQLIRDFELIAPESVDFIDPSADFVRLVSESEESVGSIERRHLDAITRADFVWLHAFDGYVGTSAALEVGHARALGIPVFSDKVPRDETLRSFVQTVPSPEAVPQRLAVMPGKGLAGLQAYYGRVARRRGWDSETASDTLLLLTEEFGELAREVRRSRGLRRDQDYNGALELELADVQLYLVHLANTLDVDIASAVTAKERINEARFDKRQSDVA
jgi:NTP pyrophosphatase (non-canonical NTP hydrolase)